MQAETARRQRRQVDSVAPARPSGHVGLFRPGRIADHADDRERAHSTEPVREQIEQRPGQSGDRRR